MESEKRQVRRSTAQGLLTAWPTERTAEHTHAHTHGYPPCIVSSSCKNHGVRLHMTASEKSCRKETCFFDCGAFLFSKRVNMFYRKNLKNFVLKLILVVAAH